MGGAVGDDVVALGRVLEAWPLEPHAHAVGGLRDGVGALQQRAQAGGREVVVLRPEHDAHAARRGEIERREHDLLALGRRRLLQGQDIAGPERAALESADGGADQRRLAAEHGGDVEAALDGQIGDGAAGERADPQHLPALQAHALIRSRAPATAVAVVRGEDVDGVPAPRRRRCGRCRPPRAASAPGRRSPARPHSPALPTRRLAARRLTWSSAPDTGTPRCW